jgi:HK97 gp10 family phage protein
MNIKLEFNEDDIERLTKRLGRLTVDDDGYWSAAGTIGDSLEKCCAKVERSAKQKAPKDTGALRRSITSKIEREGNEMVGYVFTPLEYAPYVEYGTGLFAESGARKDVPWCYQDDKGEWHSTSGQKPQPFMRPALTENREAILRELRRAIRNA